MFTYGLTQGAGLGGPMPCDTNGGGLAGTSAPAAYISALRDPWLSESAQHIRACPAHSDCALYFREERHSGLNICFQRHDPTIQGWTRGKGGSYG